MIFLNLIPLQYKIAAALVFLAVSHGYVYFKGRSHGLEKYYEFKQSVESAMDELHRIRELREAEQAKVQAESEAGWRDAVAAAGKRNIRVQPIRCPSGLSSVSTSTQGLNAAATQPGLDTTRVITTEKCEEVANNASVDAAKVFWLQDWITKTHEASKKK